MSRRDTVTLLIVSLIVFSSVAWLIQTPGYMDSEYYFANAQRLAGGHGFTEPFLWNFLDDPGGIPHPSHTYWMPLTSLISAASMRLLGTSFRAGQLPFIALAVFLPLFTVRLAGSLYQNRAWIWQAGLFALFSGFYLPYMLTTDTFTLYAWIGGGALWLAADASRRGRTVKWLGVGWLVGLAQLARADGFLLLLPALLAITWSQAGRWRAVVLVVFGWLLTISPWLIRNVVATGSLLSPGASRGLWLLSYDELFSYPADLLSPARWWDSGLLSILALRIKALGVNIQRLIAENGLLFLGPFMAIGVVHLWGRRLVRLCIYYLLLLLGVMSFIFPFAGSNGGFFHSGTAVMPMLWALAPVGIARAVEWAGNRRAWNTAQAKSVFAASAVAFAILITCGLSWSKVVGGDWKAKKWNTSFESYRELGVRLKQIDPAPGRVAVNNPPGFYLATGIEAVVVPNASPDMLKSMVEQYSVRWVILDANRPEALAPFFDEGNTPGWAESAIWLENVVGRRYRLIKVGIDGGSS